MNKKNLIIAGIASITVLLIAVIIVGVFHLKNDTKFVEPESSIGEYSVKEVKQANTLNNCLIANNGVIYNLSGFVENHGDILKICGQIDPDLASVNLKYTQISSYNVGILAP